MSNVQCTYQLPFIYSFPKRVLTIGRQVVDPQHQTPPQKQSVTKPGVLPVRKDINYLLLVSRNYKKMQVHCYVFPQTIPCPQLNSSARKHSRLLPTVHHHDVFTLLNKLTVAQVHVLVMVIHKNRMMQTNKVCAEMNVAKLT